MYGADKSSIYDFFYDCEVFQIPGLRSRYCIIQNVLYTRQREDGLHSTYTAMNLNVMNAVTYNEIPASSFGRVNL